MQNKIQSLLDKIALKSHKIGEIAQDLAYGTETPEASYIHFLPGNMHMSKLEYEKKGLGTVRQAFHYNYLYPYEGYVFILTNRKGKLERALAKTANWQYHRPLPPSFLAKIYQYDKPKLVFHALRYHLKCDFDTKKHFLFDHAIYLRFRVDVEIDYYFATVFFYSKLCRFLHQKTRQTSHSISTTDIAALYFPKIDLITQTKLLPHIHKLLLQYEVYYDEKNSFWNQFGEYYYKMLILETDFEANFYHLEWAAFLRKINQLKIKIGDTGVAEKRSSSWLKGIFDRTQFTLQAMSKEIQIIENEINRVLYAFYDLSEKEIKIVEKG